MGGIWLILKTFSLVIFVVYMTFNIFIFLKFKDINISLSNNIEQYLSEPSIKSSSNSSNSEEDMIHG